MKVALERHKKEEAVVIPVILRSCPWQHTPLKDLQALPKDGKPVTKWTDEADAYTDVLGELIRLLNVSAMEEKQKLSQTLESQSNIEERSGGYYCPSC